MNSEAIKDFICHTTAECAAMYKALPWSTKAPALLMLKDELASAASHIREDYAQSPKDWYVPHHFGWGMAVRNLLRKKGFGEEHFGIHNLDDIYIALVTEALELEKQL